MDGSVPWWNWLSLYDSITEKDLLIFNYLLQDGNKTLDPTDPVSKMRCDHLICQRRRKVQKETKKRQLKLGIFDEDSHPGLRGKDLQVFQSFKFWITLVLSPELRVPLPFIFSVCEKLSIFVYDRKSYEHSDGRVPLFTIVTQQKVTCLFSCS